MIISISGRKHSGKTMLANEAIKRGFIKISFADKLKKITSQLLGCSIEDLCDPILKESKLERSISWIDLRPKLEKILNLSTPKNIENKTLNSRRDVLQFLGTEVLRKIDPEFHVNSLKDQIEADKDYVLDDTRFINELNLLNTLKAVCILTIRPYSQEYSNHSSETELNRKYFERIIVNSQSKEKILEHFSRFLENKTDLKNTVSSRSGGQLSNFFLSETEESCYTSGIIYATSRKIIKNNCLLLEINSSARINQPEDLFCIFDNKRIVDHQIYIDDFKRWNILQENKCMHSYPEILEGKKGLQKCWFEGIKKGLETKCDS